MLLDMMELINTAPLESRNTGLLLPCCTFILTIFLLFIYLFLNCCLPFLIWPLGVQKFWYALKEILLYRIGNLLLEFCIIVQKLDKKHKVLGAS